MLLCYILQAVLSALNPTAKLITTTNSTVEPSEVLQTGLWSVEKAQGSAAWVQLMRQNPDSTPLLQQQQHHHNDQHAYAADNGGGCSSSCCGTCNHSHEPAAAAAAANGTGGVTAAATRSTASYGVTHFVYRARWPFHPGRLHNFMVSFFVLQEPDWQKLMAEDEDHREDNPTSTDATSTDDLASPLQPGVTNVTSDTAQQLQEVAGARRAAFEARFGLLLRSKGFVWLATRGGHIGEWSQAGSLLSFSTGEAYLQSYDILLVFIEFHVLQLCSWPQCKMEPGRQPAQLLHR
jgi:G3E family GTPase